MIVLPQGKHRIVRRNSAVSRKIVRQMRTSIRDNTEKHNRKSHFSVAWTTFTVILRKGRRNHFLLHRGETLPLPLIPFGIVAYAFVGQISLKQLYRFGEIPVILTLIEDIPRSVQFGRGVPAKFTQYRISSQHLIAPLQKPHSTIRGVYLRV